MPIEQNKRKISNRVNAKKNWLTNKMATQTISFIETHLYCLSVHVYPSISDLTLSQKSIINSQSSSLFRGLVALSEMINTFIQTQDSD